MYIFLACVGTTKSKHSKVSSATANRICRSQASLDALLARVLQDAVLMTVFWSDLLSQSRQFLQCNALLTLRQLFLPRLRLGASMELLSLCPVHNGNLLVNFEEDM